MLTAITTLIGYFIFIPRYSYLGAAAVTIYSEILIAILIFSISFYYIRFIPNLSIVIKSAIACLFMGMGLYYLDLTLIPAILISAIIYSSVLYLLAKNNFKRNDKIMKNIEIKQSDIGQRLDVFLTDKLDSSRSQIQKLIKQGTILINDKKKSSHYKIQEGDKIIVKNTEAQSIASKKNQILPKFKIIAETDDYLVINKPSGVIVHRGDSIEGATLADTLEKQYPKIKKVGEDPLRPGIVHRLDKEASGLMVVAKNNKIFDHLKNQFQKRETLKNILP